MTVFLPMSADRAAEAPDPDQAARMLMRPLKIAALGVAPLEPPADCQGCQIRRRAVCSMCDASELIELDRIKTYRSYQPGEEIVATGEEMHFCGSVVTGYVSLKRTLADGRRQMVGLLFPSDFLGRPMRREAQYDAEALTEVTLCTFDRRRFEGVLGHSPALEKRLLQMTLDELDAAREWLLLLGRKTAREKIASFIGMVGRRAGTLDAALPHEGQAFDLPLSRENMAEYLGLTIETVSRQINGMKKEGLIELISARRLIVLDYALLLESAGDDEDGTGVVGWI